MNATFAYIIGNASPASVCLSREKMFVGQVKQAHMHISALHTCVYCNQNAGHLSRRANI